MYSTSSEHTRVPWAAHALQRRLLGRDRALRVLRDGDRGRRLQRRHANDPGGSDGDDAPASAPTESLLVQIGGCIGTDFDFDGPSYHNWPGVAGARTGHDADSTPIAVHEPALQRDHELLPRRVRDRPAADRGARLRRHLQPDDRRRMREPASGGELLSHLHDRHASRRSVRLAASAGPRCRGRRTRSAATRRPSSGRCSSSSIRNRRR